MLTIGLATGTRNQARISTPAEANMFDWLRALVLITAGMAFWALAASLTSRWRSA
jgi:hypothetical protein